MAVEPRGALEPHAAAREEEGRTARADLASAERAVAAADAAVRAARFARLPTVRAFGRLAHHASDPFGDGGAYLIGGIEVRVPVFTGFATRAEVQRARALRSAAAHELAALEIDARREVESARGRLVAARGGWEAARTAAASSREALRLVRRRFEEGMATTSDLLAAQSSAATHEAAEVAALADLHRAAHTLTFVTGSAPAPMAAPAERSGGAP
jgi:outer membrane protein